MASDAEIQRIKNAISTSENDTWNKLNEEQKHIIYNDLADIDFYLIAENFSEIEEQIASGTVDGDYTEILNIFLTLDQPGFLADALLLYPKLGPLLGSYLDLRKNIVQEKKQEASKKKTFGEMFGIGFEDANNHKTTLEKLGDYLTQVDKEWPKDEPESVFPWEMRIGLSRFIVPPISIDVNKNFKIGSLSGAAIRQPNSPKFNSGHSETMVTVTLYFPNHESIWGLPGSGDQELLINFEDPSSADEIDKLASSLRGLVTQFKYVPFLPVRNDYLNKTYDIHAVAMHSMTMTTIPSFPHCIAVTLNMLKFNYSLYLPMVPDFHQAFLWGRYRNYLGRAMQKMESISNQGFLVSKEIKEDVYKVLGRNWGEKLSGETVEGDDMYETFGRDIRQKLTGDITGNTTTVTEYEREPDSKLKSPYVSFKESQYRDDTDGKRFDLYFPTKTPSKIFAPDDSTFRRPAEDESNEVGKSSWESFLSLVGISINQNPDAVYEAVTSYSNNIASVPTEREMLLEYVGNEGVTALEMNDTKLNEFMLEAISDYILNYKRKNGGQEPSSGDIESLKDRLKVVWFDHMFNNYKATPWYKAYIENAEYKNGQFLLEEWTIPMEKAIFNDKNIHIMSVSVSLANNIVKNQVQMQPEPAYQHIGGKDSQIDIALRITGEDELIQLERIFKHVQGLARLESAHGVLGFLGIKNYITALAGIKYVLPFNMEVKTIPGFPRVYDVMLSFVDFDIFQQKRENLSSEQQKELVESFGKRNPFLRIKQLWGQVNAYPDLPLSVRDENDKVIGHLSPDYYFRAFDTIQDDIVNWGIGDRKKWNPASTAQKWIKESADKVREQDKNYETPSTDTPADADSNLPNGTTLSGPVDNTGSSLGTAVELVNEAQQDVLKYFLGITGENQDTALWLHNRAGKIALETKTVIKEAGQQASSSKTEEMILNDQLATTVQTTPAVPGLTPGAEFQHPYMDGSNDPTGQYEKMMQDAKYRSINGRMIRAMPTYMLWLIDEGGRFAGVKLFDNFYGLQSVIDFSIHRSEDVLADTLVLNLSNLYGKLSTPFNDYLNYDNDDDILATSETTSFDDRMRNIRLRSDTINENLKSGTIDSYVVDIKNIRLRPGVRVHLRMGYSADPNALETVFNGTITEVKLGDMVTVTAQSDAIELAQYLNTTDKKGHSGKVDGSLMTGLYMSEPRDLMVRLLSMGASTVKEAFAHAMDGMIFSENKFGIRHFGNMLYGPLTEEEEEAQEFRYNTVKSAVDNLAASDDAPSAASAAAGLALTTVDEEGNSNADTANAYESQLNSGDTGFFSSALGASNMRSPVLSAMQSMMVNFYRKRDYEIFKRNIYPGNGYGIAQFLGGDISDAGMAMMQAKGSISREESKNRFVNFPELGKDVFNKIQTPTLTEASEVLDEADDSGVSTDIVLEELEEGVQQEETGVDTTGALSSIVGALYIPDIQSDPLWQMLGVASDVVDDDLAGYDEVSFRAQTYMKTVWDMFKICAALLPNYIVAVRPFEDRSTIFYGKPHWLYTSGLIPVTTGIPKGEEPDLEMADLSLNKSLLEVANAINPLSDYQEQLDFYKALGTRTDLTSSLDPSQTAIGTALKDSEADVAALPDIHPNGAKLPVKRGKVAGEQHLPTTADTTNGTILLPKTEWKAETHKQYTDLPANLKFPVYEGQFDGYRNSEGAGAWGPMSPEHEQFYIAMRWPYATWGATIPTPGVTQEMYRWGPSESVKILVYAPKTGRACVCVPGDAGPGDQIDRVGGLSQDTMFALGIVTDDEVIFGFVPDETPLGPIESLGSKNFAGKLGEQTRAKLQPEIDTYQATKPIKDFNWIPDEGEDFYDPKYKEDPALFAYEHGFYNSGNELAPVMLESKDLRVKDQTGIDARRIYDDDYNESFNDENVQKFKDLFLIGKDDTESFSRSFEEANSIWGQVRREFFGTGAVKDIFNEVYAGKGQEWLKSEEAKDTYNDLVNVFLMYMWRDPRARAWVVLTMDKAVDNTQLFTVPLADANVDVAPTDADDIPGVNFFTDRTYEWDIAGSPITVTAWRHFIGSTESGGLANKFIGVDSIESLEDVLSMDVINSPTFQEMGQFLLDNFEKGSTASDQLSRIREELGEAWDASLGKIMTGLASGLGGLVSMFRMSLQQMGIGLDMVGTMQQQANILNRVLNDSIYYKAGTPGSSERLVDNPFTREYGEPVVEVREPFQRVHYLSSFQHIIGNNITESGFDNATVVTASSDGQYPVTVYFDKGSAPERQIEKAVETGLFWDNAQGEGFFSFLHPFMHPIEALRGNIKDGLGSNDELSSKRVALWHLKESLKDIYTGEVVIIGDPSIRPYDLVYLADVYERIYGMFEVEQVVHHFTPENGFYTSITPNAIVTINDPARWSGIAYMQSMMQKANLRDDVRQLLNIKSDGSASLDYGVSPETFSREIAQATEVQMKGHIQYTQGNAALVNDITAQIVSGYAPMSDGEKVLATTSLLAKTTERAASYIPGMFTLDSLAEGVGDALGWFTDNLLDQHGCYISYLNKDGQPMDAGLSYNQGVAVGRHHSINLLPGILGLPAEFNVTENGHSRITTNDLLGALGWSEISTTQLHKEVSLWVDQTNAQILKAAGKSPDIVNHGNVEVFYERITEVVDADTINTESGASYRLIPLDAPETTYKGDLEGYNPDTEEGYIATNFVRDLLLEIGGGELPSVAIRINRNDKYDFFGTRILAVMFHRVPEGTPEEEREAVLTGYASQIPIIPWDSYMQDSHPYTLNWETIAAGYARVNMAGVQLANPDKGLVIDE